MESLVEVVGCSVGSDGSPRLLVRSSPTAHALALPAAEVERRWPAQTLRFYRHQQFPSQGQVTGDTDRVEGPPADGQGMTAAGATAPKAPAKAPECSKRAKTAAEAHRSRETQRQNSKASRCRDSAPSPRGKDKAARAKSKEARRPAAKTEPESGALAALSRSVAALNTLTDLVEEDPAPADVAAGRKGAKAKKATHEGDPKAAKAKKTTAAKKKKTGDVAGKAQEAKLRVLRRYVLDVLRSAQAKRRGPLSARALTRAKILKRLPGHIRHATKRADLKTVLLHLVKTDGLVKRFAGDPEARRLAEYALVSSPEGLGAPLPQGLPKAAQPAAPRRPMTENGDQTKTRSAKARLPRGAIQSAMRDVLERAGDGGLRQATLVRQLTQLLGQGKLGSIIGTIYRLIAKGFISRGGPGKLIRLCPGGPTTGTEEKGGPKVRQVLQTLLGEAGPAGLGLRELVRRALPHYGHMTASDTKHCLLKSLVVGIRNGWYEVVEGGRASEGPFRLGPVRPRTERVGLPDKVREAAAALHHPDGFLWAELAAHVRAHHPGLSRQQMNHLCQTRLVLIRRGHLRPTTGAHRTRGPFTYHPDPHAL